MNDMAGGKRRWLSRTFIYLILLIFLILYLAPFVLILLNSFKTKKGIIQDPLQLIDPAGFTLENFTKAFEKMENSLRLFVVFYSADFFNFCALYVL